jgi:phosphate transport system substrate-binding protein
MCQMPLSNIGSGRRCFGASMLALLLALAGSARAGEEIKIGGTGAALGTMQLLAVQFGHSNPGIRIITVPNLGSAGGIKAVSSGAIDLALTSRPLNESEGKLALSQWEYARTPFVFAVSSNSAERAITRRELADIYAGKAAKWADGSAIRLVLRPPSDIDTEMVRSLGPDIAHALAAAEKRPGVQFSVTDQDAAGDLERIPGAIGPSSLALIVSERRALRTLRLDGVEPTPANAAAKTYPLYKHMFFVTGRKRAPAVELFIAFVQSESGRKILSENGHWVP